MDQFSNRVRAAPARSSRALRIALADRAARGRGAGVWLTGLRGPPDWVLLGRSLASYVEIHEWVASRPILYEADDTLLIRWLGRSEVPAQTEIARKKGFMDRLAGLCRQMGADGLARQYDWYSMISQANVLTRAAAASEFIAVDCRPGLAFPFFLPLSPAHLRICLQGLRRGVLAHYDECDLARLEAFLASQPLLATGLAQLVEQLHADNTAYRGALPDLWHRGFQFLIDPDLRRRLRAASVEDWARTGLAAPQTGEALKRSGLAFSGIFLLQIIPLVGPVLARMAANPSYRSHLIEILRGSAYRKTWLDLSQARDLAEWEAVGRIPADHSTRLRSSMGAYLAEKLACAWMPVGLHRFLIDPAAQHRFLDAKLLQPLRLLTRQAARTAWLESIIQFELDRGVLTGERAAALIDQTHQPQMHGFIRDLGFTAGLDVFSRLVYLVLGLYAISTGDLLPLGLAALGPIPPSGPLRVVYLLGLLANDLLRLVRRRHIPRAGRLILARLGALLIAPWRGIGNLFPVMEMSAFYPRLSLLLADYHIEQAVNSIPVLGGRGKLLEYWVFQASYNLPMSVKRFIRELLPQKPDAVDEHAHLEDKNP